MSGPAEPAQGFFRFTATRPVAITMVMLTVAVFGWVGLAKLPITLLPDITYPSVTVRTEYPGASPEDVEDRVSERIQEAVSVAAGVRRVVSVSRPEVSDVILEFAWGTQMVFAVGELREKLDRVFLPREARQPLILRYDPTLDPIMTIGLSGPLPTVALRRIAEDEIEEVLAEVDGVAAVKVRGGDEDEIRIAVDERRLTGFGLDVALIGRRLAAENMNASAGSVDEGHTEYLVRTLNEFRDLDEIRDLILVNRGGSPVRIRDVADVKRVPKDPEVITRVDGQPAVLVDIHKEAESNLVEVARRVKDRLLGTKIQRAWVAGEAARRAAPAGPAAVSAVAPGPATETAPAAGKDAARTAKADAGKAADKQAGERRFREKLQRAAMTDYIAHGLPREVVLSVLTDQSRFIESAVAEVRDSAVLGGLLAVIVLYLFLRRGQPTLIIAISIPISLIATFAPMFLTGVTMNIMSLGGLALGVGMLVDNSIVVLEAITRLREQGLDRINAAIQGVASVAGAVTASTLTTVAVFFPIVFVDGVAGQLFRDQALTVVYSLLVSLAVSLTVVPMLATRGLPSAHAPGAATAPAKRGLLARAAGLPVLAVKGLALSGLYAARAALAAFGTAWKVITFPLVWVFSQGYGAIAAAYPAALRGALAARPLVIAAALILFFFALRLIPGLGNELLPEVHQREFATEVFLPRDTTVEQTDRVVAPLEQAIRKLPGVTSTFLAVGVEKSELASSDEGEHSAKIRATLDPALDPIATEAEVRRLVQGLLERMPEVSSSRFSRPTLFTIKAPVSVEIVGRDLGTLRRLAEEVARELAQVPGLTDVRSSMQRGNTEVVISFDRESMAAFGLDAAEVARGLTTKVHGDQPTRFTERDRKVDIRVVVEKDEIPGVARLLEMNVNSGIGAAIPLGSVAEVREVEGPSEIRRLGNVRGAEVSANVAGFDLGGVQRGIEERLATITEPRGFAIRMGGQKEELEQTTSSMTFALLLAVFLVYIVMAIQFESLVQPLVILFTVPLGLIGVVFALAAADIALSVVVFLGCIILAGIVVNNAIVMLDYINQLRATGMPKREAIVTGASARLRPVMMTTLTTVLGLLPLTGWLGNIPLVSAGGEGVELRAPMAITVIAGLSVSTLLTLFVIPVVYTFADRRP